MIAMNRRGFLLGLTSVLAAPVIVRASTLMPIKMTGSGLSYADIGDAANWPLFQRKLQAALPGYRVTLPEYYDMGSKIAVGAEELSTGYRRGAKIWRTNRIEGLGRDPVSDFAAGLRRPA